MYARLGSRRKDGTYNRYYVCYYSGTSKKSIESKRDKCDLPFIPAIDLEEKIWTEILIMFNLNSKKLLQQAFDPKKYEEQAHELKLSIERLELDLSAIEKKRDRLLQLENLDEDQFIADDLSRELRNNKTRRIEIEGNLKRTKEELSKLQKLRDSQKEYIDALIKNLSTWKLLCEGIESLADTDKKLLIESMLVNPGLVDYIEPDDNMPEIGRGVQFHYRLRYNSEILIRFINEGKIKGLDHDSTDYLELIDILSATI